MMKIIVYGGYESGKYALARQLLNDNPFLGDPTIIKNLADMRRFVTSPISSLGIVSATNVRAIMGKSEGAKFGSVLFVAAPGAIELIENPQTVVGREKEFR